MFKSWFGKKTKSNKLNWPPFSCYSIGSVENEIVDNDLSYETEYLYTHNVIALRCINLIASAVASVKIIVTDEHGNHLGDDHSISKILKRPNCAISYCELMESIVAHKLISGNAYILLLKNRNLIKELHILRPDKVKISQGKSNLPHSYIYHPNESESDILEFLVDQVTGNSDIIHIKNFHPSNDLYGLSALSTARNSIEQYNQSGEWNMAMLKNGARPSGALIVRDSANGNKTLTTEQYERLKFQVDQYYSGSNNTGRPILLEGGLDWKEMSLSPKDMDFISMKHSTAREIALALGVPSQLIGIPGDNTYNNLAEARLSLWEQTIIPILNGILMHLNEKLSHATLEKFKITYNKDDIEIFIERREKLWQYVENSTFMTLNEKRKLFGLPSITGGDDLPNNSLYH